LVRAALLCQNMVAGDTYKRARACKVRSCVLFGREYGEPTVDLVHDR
jgi:hypothetical protein